MAIVKKYIYILEWNPSGRWEESPFALSYTNLRKAMAALKRARKNSDYASSLHYRISVYLKVDVIN